jgi:phosphoglycerate kinase
MAAADKAGSTIVLPVDAVVAAQFKEGASSKVVAIDAVPADMMILDVGPKSVEAVNAWISSSSRARSTIFSNCC